MTAVGWLHHYLAFRRRVQVLASVLSDVIPRDGTLLDVGCGDGTVASLIGTQRPDLSVSGLDVVARPASAIPVELFDGRTIPRADHAVDTVMLVDVLHHADDPEGLLREARRVARRAVVIKDHTREGVLAGPTLRFMDWVGNAPHGVARRYQYWSLAEWRAVFGRLGCRPSLWRDRLDLYPPPASWIFERRLHFLARLDLVVRG